MSQEFALFFSIPAAPKRLPKKLTRRIHRRWQGDVEVVEFIDRSRRIVCRIDPNVDPSYLASAISGWMDGVPFRDIFEDCTYSGTSHIERRINGEWVEA